MTKIAFSFKKRTKKHTVRHNRRSSSVHKLPAALTQPADTVAGNHAASCATQLWVLPKGYEALLTWMGLCLTISFTSMYSNGGWGKRRKKKHNQTLNEWNNVLKWSWTVLVRKWHLNLVFFFWGGDVEIKSLCKANNQTQKGGKRLWSVCFLSMWDHRRLCMSVK